jgi:hypothetical protein
MRWLSTKGEKAETRLGARHEQAFSFFAISSSLARRHIVSISGLWLLYVSSIVTHLFFSQAA